MTKNAGAGPKLTRPGCQTCTKNAGAGTRVNIPSLNDSIKVFIFLGVVNFIQPQFIGYKPEIWILLIHI